MVIQKDFQNQFYTSENIPAISITDIEVDSIKIKLYFCRNKRGCY
jgi:hypothetical protein